MPTDADWPRSDARSVADRNDGLGEVERRLRSGGEPAFRGRETEVIAEIADRQGPAVVAAGGGAVIAPGNGDVMRRSGSVCWLTGHPADPAARLAGDRGRPLLVSGTPKARLKNLLSRRNPLYRRAARRVVDTSGQTAEEVAAEVVELWNGS